MKNYLKINEIHKIDLELLRTFDDFCKKHDLKYYICYGTLLGAVRHKGFIPWDDDVDVMMIRSEYERLIDICKKEEKESDRYKLVYPTGGGMHGGFSKWMDTNVSLKRKFMFKGMDDSYLGLDIFPFDKVPSDIKVRKAILKQANLCRYLFDVSSLRIKNTFLNIVQLILLFPFHLVPLRLYDKWQNKIVKKAEERICSDGYMYMQITWNFSGVNEQVAEDDIKKIEPERIQFENLMLPVFDNYKDFLEGVYGDYMTLPPENKRRTHDMYAERVK